MLAVATALLVCVIITIVGFALLIRDVSVVLVEHQDQGGVLVNAPRVYTHRRYAEHVSLEDTPLRDAIAAYREGRVTRAQLHRAWVMRFRRRIQDAASGRTSHFYCEPVTHHGCVPCDGLLFEVERSVNLQRRAARQPVVGSHHAS